MVAANADALDDLHETNLGITANLGTGKALSVLDMIQAFQTVTGVEIADEIVGRCQQDVAELNANHEFAKSLLAGIPGSN